MFALLSEHHKQLAKTVNGMQLKQCKANSSP